MNSIATMSRENSLPLGGGLGWGLVRQIILFAIFALALLLNISAHADSIATLKPATDLDRPTVRLSDVFEGVPVAIDREIATAPAPGKSVVYNVKILMALADQYRLDWQPQSVMDNATITRTSTRITQDMVRGAVLEKIKQENLVGTVDVAFDGRAIEINLPSTSAPDFALNNFNYDDGSKRFRADLIAAPGSPNMVSLPVTGRVNIKRDVPVLARRLESGSTIGEADLAWATLSAERITTDMITEASQIVGRELRHDSAEGAPIRSRDVIPARLVTRGSLVQMKIQTMNMTVTTQGRALQDGAKGDTIRVNNTRSNRTIEGIVEGPGIVRIETAAKLASAG